MLVNWKNQLCPHCDPYPDDDSHFGEKLEMLLSPITILLNPIERIFKLIPNLHTNISKIIFEGLANTLVILKIFKEVEAHDTDEDIHNRSLVVVREARKRGIIIKSLKFYGKSMNIFQ